jgi:hypothetical protein
VIVLTARGTVGGIKTENLLEILKPRRFDEWLKNMQNNGTAGTEKSCSKTFRPENLKSCSKIAE